MGFIDKVKTAIGLGPDEEYGDYDMFDMMPGEEEEQPTYTSRKSKVVNLNAASQMKVVVMQPEDFEDARTIADHLKTKRPVIINLEDLESTDARRVVDFLSGAVYGLEGNIQKISSGIFIIVPYNVSIMGDFKDEVKGKGIFSFGGM